MHTRRPPCDHARDPYPGTVPRASPTGAAAPAPGARRSTVTGAVIEQILPGVAVAAVVALALTALSGGRTYARLGLPDPGAVVTYGLPVVRALTESAAVVTVGALLLAAFLAPPPGSCWLAADGYRAVRLASWAAAGWAAGALVTSVLAVADAFGRPLGEVLTPTVLRESWGGLPMAQAWLVTAFVALVCCGLARVALAWPTTVAAFALAVVGLLPVALTGHSATGGAHDLAVNSLVLHVSAAALWVGGLVAVLVHTVAGGSFTTTVLRRFSALALGCWVVLAATGLVNALLRVPPSELLRTTYGLLVLAKVAGLAVLGLIGARHRSHTLPTVAAGSRAGLVRLGGVEVLVMFATVGVAVALGRTPPPEISTPLPSRVEALLGYGLDRPLDLPGLVTAARPDLLLGTGAVVAALAYLVAVRRAGPWNRGHTTAWLAGCAVLLVATSSGIGRYAPAQFSVHMGQQVAVGVVVPLLLVLGRRGRLVRAVTRPAAPGGSPGPREWGPALRASWAVRGRPRRWWPPCCWWARTAPDAGGGVRHPRRLPRRSSAHDGVDVRRRERLRGRRARPGTEDRGAGGDGGRRRGGPGGAGLGGARGCAGDRCRVLGTARAAVDRSRRGPAGRGRRPAGRGAALPGGVGGRGTVRTSQSASASRAPPRAPSRRAPSRRAPSRRAPWRRGPPRRTLRHA